MTSDATSSEHSKQRNAVPSSEYCAWLIAAGSRFVLRVGSSQRIVAIDSVHLRNTSANGALVRCSIRRSKLACDRRNCCRISGDEKQGARKRVAAPRLPLRRSSRVSVSSAATIGLHAGFSRKSSIRRRKFSEISPTGTNCSASTRTA